MDTSRRPQHTHIYTLSKPHATKMKHMDMQIGIEKYGIMLSTIDAHLELKMQGIHCQHMEYRSAISTCTATAK